MHDDSVIRREESRLYSTHEEADSRMFHHVAFSTYNHNSIDPINIVVRTVDADCLVISLGCFKTLRELNTALNLWLEVGLETKNNLRYINVNQIYEKVGELLSLSLPALHAFFGCDYLAAFSRKGKIRPLKLLEQNVDAQVAFSGLGKGKPDVDEDNVQAIEKFVCSVYGKKQLSSVNEVRFQIFVDKYKPRKENQCIT